jgi:hypothetical protein
MALNKPPLKAAIKAALLAARTETNPANFTAAMDTLAGAITDAVDTFMKSGAVTVTVTSVGGVTPGGGASGPGTGTGTIS